MNSEALQKFSPSIITNIDFMNYSPKQNNQLWVLTYNPGPGCQHYSVLLSCNYSCVTCACLTLFLSYIDHIITVFDDKQSCYPQAKHFITLKALELWLTSQC